MTSLVSSFLCSFVIVFFLATKEVHVIIGSSLASQGAAPASQSPLTPQRGGGPRGF